jgi:peptide/nickel transport system substrate-binding protein
MSCGQTTTFTRNFNPFAANPLVPTLFGVYEPLMINNSAKGEIVPWLADKYAWSTDNKSLTFTLHDGVKWSDGQPFTSSDVAYTFNLIKNTGGLNGPGTTAMRGAGAYVDSISTPDAKTVVFNFKQVFIPGFYDLITQDIVPEHIWKDVQDPVKFTNDNPVGTGPFTQIVNFQAQTFEIDKNPNYWQAGKPAFKGIRCPAMANNDQVNLQLASGALDWAQGGFPNIEQNYVAKNPNNYGYWFQPNGGVVSLALNTTKKPFDDVNVRKAISMAINRTQITTVAVYNYVKPADVTGIAEGYPQLKVSDPTKLGNWTNFDANKANQMLDAAGLKKGADGIRTLPDGTKMQYQITVANGFAIFVAAANIIVQNLKAVGITATLQQTDVAGWIDREQKGSFDMIMIATAGNTFYSNYRQMMSKATTAPIGEAAVGGNYGRYVSAKGDQLLDQFAQTAEPGKQKDLAQQIQQVFADEAPLVPLYPNPLWYEYNSTRFTGWPSKDNPYVLGTYGQIAFSGEPLIVLTTIKPR